MRRAGDVCSTSRVTSAPRLKACGSLVVMQPDWVVMRGTRMLEAACTSSLPPPLSRAAKLFGIQRPGQAAVSIYTIAEPSSAETPSPPTPPTPAVACSSSQALQSCLETPYGPIALLVTVAGCFSTRVPTPSWSPTRFSVTPLLQSLAVDSLCFTVHLVSGKTLLSQTLLLDGVEVCSCIAVMRC